MERNIKFLNWKNKYCENYISQINLWIILNIYQPINHIFQRIRKKKKKSFTTCMETQKTSHSQNNLEKEEWSWMNE